MIDFLRKYRYHFLLILTGLAVLAIVNGWMHFDRQGIIYPDSAGYFEAAKNLYVYHIGHNYRPLLMAAITGIPYLFGAQDAFIYEFACYVNIFCWLATALLLFELLRQFLNVGLSFLFAFCSFLFIGQVALIYHLLSESIYTLMLVAVFCLLQGYYKNRSFWALSLALSILVASMLVRPGSKWLAVAFLVFYLREILRFYDKKPALLIYASLLLVVVQCAGIRYQFGNFTISYIDSVTYYNYLGSKAVALREGKDFEAVKQQRGSYIYAFNLDGQKIRETAFNDAMEQLKGNKANLLKAYVFNLIENSTAENVVVWDAKNTGRASGFETAKAFFLAVTRWQNILFTLCGMMLSAYFLLKKDAHPLLKKIGFCVLYTVLLSGISSQQGDRFHLVVFPLVLVLLAGLCFRKSPNEFP